MAQPSKRRTVWKDAIAPANTLAATTVVEEILLAEADIESLGSGVTVTRIVGSLSLHFAAGVTNVVAAAIWVRPTYLGAAAPTSLNIDFFERSRTMWTMQRMIDPADDTTLVPIDIRTQRKLGSGVELDLVIENKSAQIVTFAYHLRSLVLLP